MIASLHVWSFLGALSLMLLHEMDAVRCREWRIFPLTAMLPERTGMLVFYWAHVPILAVVLWLASRSVSTGGDSFSFGFGVFCVLHAFVHWAYERHPLCEFTNPLSRSIIWSCAVAGGISAAAWIFGM